MREEYNMLLMHKRSGKQVYQGGECMARKAFIKGCE